MSSIVFGLIAMCIGLWGIVSYWWYVADVFLALLPICLLFVGFIALMAGIKKTGLKAKINVFDRKPGEENTMKEKY
jgi:hypothetical protein